MSVGIQVHEWILIGVFAAVFQAINFLSRRLSDNNKVIYIRPVTFYNMSKMKKNEYHSLLPSTVHSITCVTTAFLYLFQCGGFGINGDECRLMDHAY